MQWVKNLTVAAVAMTTLLGGTVQSGLPRALELVVFETQFCGPCRDFRYDTVKPYFRSERGTDLPMLVVDYDHLGTAGRALKKPIDTLPTTVILDRGREVGRIVGNPVHNSFVKQIDALIEANS